MNNNNETNFIKLNNPKHHYVFESYKLIIAIVK